MLGKTYKINTIALPRPVEKKSKSFPKSPEKHESGAGSGKIRDKSKNPPRSTRNIYPILPTAEQPQVGDEDKENSSGASKKFQAILHKCSVTGTKFVDEDFPARKESLYRSSATRAVQNPGEEQFFKGAQSITAWLRPEHIRIKGKDTEWAIINDPRPSDICQGEIGNCWFVAALALIAERKELLAKILGTSETNEAGAYLIRLFKDGTWKDVIVDDLLPCDSFQRLVFSSCRRKQLWVMLIEKAMAKLHGSYESLQSGSIWDGLNYLTGFVSERIFLKSEEDRELLWGRLLSFYSCGFLMGASITTARNIEKLYEEKGLVANHVYSILQVVCYEKTRLIQLRNPWGRFSWKGEWSDDSTLWSESMRRRYCPNKSQEGIFWMSFNNFMSYFTCMDVCQVRQGWKTYTIDGILPPCADSDCQPLFEVVCDEKTCEVDISLYQNSKRNSREFVKLTDIGFLILEFETNKSTKEVKLLRTVKLVKSLQRRCVTTTVMLPKGRYCIIPFSFGSWTHEEREEMFHAFTLTIHSSHKISCRAMSPSQIPHILADAMICCARKYGKTKKYSKPGIYDDMSTISVNLGLGYCTIIENRSKYYLEFQMNSKTNQNYSSTRSAFSTTDRVAPFHRQVVQVLTAKDPRKPGRISNSYQLQIIYDDLSNKDEFHNPGLNHRITGLHSPRPILDA